MHHFLRLALICFLLALVPLHAQDRDGNTIVQTSGVALVKPQPWSKPSEAEVLKFSAFTDRTARGSAGAGYFVLRLPSGKDTQIPSARIVKLILQPKTPTELIEDSQRSELQKSIDEMKTAIAAVPAAGTVILEYLKPLQAIASRYDAGEVMTSIVVNGNSTIKWETREKYRQLEIQKIEFRLRRAMADAKIKKDFDLNSNADFSKLTELAASDAALQARLDAMRLECAKLVSREEQDAILVKLQSPLSPSAAAILLDKLKSLSDPSPRTASVLRQADIAVELTKEIDALKLGIENLWNEESLSKGILPTAHADLTSQIGSLTSKLAVFRAGSPPAGIWLSTPAFDACVTLKDALATLQARLTERDYKAAIEGVSALMPSARQIGSKTTAALESIKSYAEGQIAKFSTLVDEGNTLLNGTDKKLAVAKFQEALAVMPDANLEKRISEIK
jgi:hypothetical protein